MTDLTAREVAVLDALRYGDRATMARLLGMSVSSVDKHLFSIRSKLGVMTNAQALRHAYAAGILTPPRRPRRTRRHVATAPLWDDAA